MKYCTHCGTELFDQAIMCPKCGCATDELEVNKSTESWNGLAIAGFIVSFFSCVVGLILSIIGLKKVRQSGENGKGLAIAGIIISAVELAVLTILFVIEIIIWLMLMLRAIV